MAGQIGRGRRTRRGHLQPVGIGQAERDRSGSLPGSGAAAHRRSSHQQDCGTVAMESVSGVPASNGDRMTHRPPQSNRAHNFRIVGTRRNEAKELNLDWQSLDSELGCGSVRCTAAPPLSPLPQRRRFSLLQIPRRTIPRASRSRVSRALLPQPHPESIPLRTTPSLEPHSSDQDGLDRTLTFLIVRYGHFTTAGASREAKRLRPCEPAELRPQKQIA